VTIRNVANSVVLLGVLTSCPLVFAQSDNNAPGVPVSVLVTLEPRHGKTVPPVEQQDITVSQGRDKRPVTSFVPADSQSGGMQLLLLIDDSARESFDTEIGTLKQFVTSLPQTTEIAIGYMRNGMTQITQNFTTDHAAAANSIRLSLGFGGADVSPYDSLSDAIRRWPNPGAQRREVVMISSGLESLGGGFTPDNPYVTKGIEDAQKAGVVVYTIYNPSAGHFGHSYWRNTWGQNFLSQLSDETGGESYYLGFGSPVSFQPFLEEITEQMKHQYILTFTAKAEKKSGMQPVKIAVTEKNASIAAPDKVFVAGL